MSTATGSVRVATAGQPGRRRTLTILAEIWLPILLVALWWFASASSTSIYFPSLQRILAALVEMLTERFGSDIVPSLQNLGAGLAIAIVAGMGIGVLLGLSPRLYGAFQPLLEFMRAIPGVAILPVMLVIFGIGSSMKIAVIAFGAFWPIMMNTVDGILGVDGMTREVSKAYKVRLFDHIFRVVLPAASPQVISGLRLSVSLSVILIVASEYIASTEGIGYLELMSARLFQMDTMWASLLLLGVLGYVANVLFRYVEHVVLRWHRGVRGNHQGS